MTRFAAVARNVALACLAVLALLSAPGRAGEADFEGDDDHDAPFFGEAKEVRTLKPLEGVRLRFEAKTGSIATFVISTNAEGRFKLRGFAKTVDLAAVAISCTKDGYRTLDVSRRRISAAADAPVEVECLLEPM